MVETAAATKSVGGEAEPSPAKPDTTTTAAAANGTDVAATTEIVDDSVQDASRRRVKVYVLSNEQNWDDVGTGHVHCTSDEEDLFLEVRSEAAGNEVLLESNVRECQGYERQQETLIVWKQPGPGGGMQDLAVSFQDPAGCAMLWQRVCACRGIDPDSKGEVESGGEEEELMLQDLEDGVPELPEAAPEMLGQLAEILAQVADERERTWGRLDREAREMVRVHVDAVTHQFLEKNHLPALLRKFADAEATEDAETLAELFRCFHALLMLGQPALYDALFAQSVETALGALGALERDPQRPKDSRADYRDFLTTRAHRTNVVPMDKELQSLIDTTYRLQYVKDVVAVGLKADDAVLQTLGALVRDNQSDIVEYLLRDEGHLLSLLFRGLRTPDTLAETRCNQVRFLLELLQTTASNTCPFQPDVRRELHSRLDSEGLLNILVPLMNDDNVHTRRATASVTWYLLDYDVRGVRLHISSSPQNQQDHLEEAITSAHASSRAGERGADDKVRPSLLKAMVSRIATETDQGVLQQVAENLSLLLEGEDMSGFSGFLSSNASSLASLRATERMLWKPDVMDAFLAPLKAFGRINNGGKSASSATPPSPPPPLSRVDETRLCRVVSFLGRFLREHGYQAKNYVVSHSVLQDAVGLMTLNSGVLTLAVLSLLRAVILVDSNAGGNRGGAFSRIIVQHDLLRPVMAVFEANGPRYNMLNSTVLALFDALDSGRCSDGLVRYVCRSFGGILRALDYVEVGRSLLSQYEQLQKPYSLYGDASSRESDSGPEDGEPDVSRTRAPHRMVMDERENGYFESEDASDSTIATADNVDADVFLPAKRAKAAETLDADS